MDNTTAEFVLRAIIGSGFIGFITYHYYQWNKSQNSGR